MDGGTNKYHWPLWTAASSSLTASPEPSKKRAPRQPSRSPFCFTCPEKHWHLDCSRTPKNRSRDADGTAHKASIDAGGKTIAVIGTPINRAYPKENAELQERIATDFLLISQVPIYRYSKQDFRWNRGFFPERNKTMSALTEATIIVEAGQTSGTLTQARAALHQGRKLFILEGSFKNPTLRWPHEFESKGAIRVKRYEDIRSNLTAHADKNR